MRKLLIGLVVVVVLIVAALFALPLLIPSDTIKGELIATIEDATGRDIRIDDLAVGHDHPLAIPAEHFGARRPCGQTPWPPRCSP